ncbi:hypothetical protein JCM6882_008229 [Rhodosporidiobolus microsporus]
MPARPAPPPRLDTSSSVVVPLRRPRSRTLTSLERDQPHRTRGGEAGSLFAGEGGGEDAWDVDSVVQGLLGVPGRSHGANNGSTSSLASSAGGGGVGAVSAGHASDSAYGTLDERELDMDDDVDADGGCCFSPISPQDEGAAVAKWKDRVAESFTARSRRRVEAALGAEAWRLRSSRGASLASPADTAQSSPEIPHTSVFTFDVAYDADSSFDSLESLVAPSTSTSTRSLAGSLGGSVSSARSSPEPSECGESDSAATRLTMASKRRKLLLSPAAMFDEGGFLARRHTLPRRAKAREPSIKVSFVSPSVSPSPTRRRASPASLPPSTASLTSSPSSPSTSTSTSLPPLTSLALALTLLVSSTSLLLTPPLIMPLSPVALRHASSSSPSDFLLHAFNAALAPFLISPSLRGFALGAANLFLLARLESSAAARGWSDAAKATLAAAAWAAIVGLRVLCGWVFGRVLGWAHPGWFSSRAIHEVGSGLAPLLLALCLLHSATSISSTSSASPSKPPSYLPATLLAANFATPVAAGGAGMWLAMCGAVVGLVLSAGFVGWSAVSSRRCTSSPSSTKGKPAPASGRSTFSPTHFLILLTLPLLARRAVPLPPSPAATSASFAQLHPAHDNLLTVLLMTAPRPGNPDFLVQTIESWLGAFPDPAEDAAGALNATALSTAAVSSSFNSPSSALPALPLSSRLRLVVYTHFTHHPLFDHAQTTFSSSSKASHYTTFHRDPRAFSSVPPNRLDQRLHVARGLEYAASLGGAYVLLTEDDFPLCEDGAEGRDPAEVDAAPLEARTYSAAWEKLQAALVATNALMPDVPDHAVASASPGHCGLFLSTGGSGLAIRTPIAARLPALLLGADDPYGYVREAAAARGEVPAQRGGEDADTPDLVIQDCLRGRIDECRSLCAPAPLAGSGAGPFVAGSARLPGGVVGERVGKSGLAGTERLLQRHLGYNASTLPGRRYGREEWACGWRQPFNGEPDVLTV